LPEESIGCKSGNLFSDPSCKFKEISDFSGGIAAGVGVSVGNAVSPAREGDTS
jgi:hypothetical protein